MTQLALTLEPGLAVRYRDLRECFAARVYHVGLGRVASALDVAPSNLSAMLSGDRHLDVSLVEEFMRQFGDTEPARFLAAKFLGDPALLQTFALAALPEALAQLGNVLAAAGLEIPGAKPKGRGR